jgi:hypothetical protein
VRGVIDATRQLASVQSGGAGGATLGAATKQRRAAVEALVDRAVKAMARFDKTAEAKRAEIRQLIDQLSRHPEVAEAWIDGTLRDLPGDAFGFGMFTGEDITVSEPARKTKSTKTPAAKAKAKKSGSRERTPDKRATETAREDAKRQAAEQAERTQRARQVRRDLAAARRDLAMYERRVASAQEAVDEAEARLQAVEEQRDDAQRRVEEMAAELERLVAQ